MVQQLGAGQSTARPALQPLLAVGARALHTTDAVAKKPLYATALEGQAVVIIRFVPQCHPIALAPYERGCGPLNCYTV